MRPARPLALAALLSALLLSGCVAPPPAIQPPPEPSTAPIFATDEEALAAATDAYAAYLKMSDLIGHDGGKDAQRISDHVTTEWLEREINGFSALAESGRHQVGESLFDNVSLQYVEETSDEVFVAIYVCHDARSVRVIDANENDVTPDQLASPWMTEVTFVRSLAPTSHLLISGNDPWVRNDNC